MALIKTPLCLGFVLVLCSMLAEAHKHSSKPMLLLVSFDGFRWDYLNKFQLANFQKLKSNGSHAEYIYNSFVTVTFPNHWTMVTGLYEETHGIIHNEMYDSTLNDTFENWMDTGAVNAKDHKWYGQNPMTEPIWITNQKSGDGRRSAASWVGSGVEFNGQTAINIPYNSSKPYSELIDQFIGMFTGDEAINFGALYFDEPDTTGHKYGPYSKEMERKLYELDKTLGYLIQQLQSHHLYDKLNLIVTSDHGMEQVSEDKTITLSEHIDISLFKAYGRRTSYNLFLKQDSDLDIVYNKLQTIEHLMVYKKSDIPDSLHYRNNVRIGDILIVARTPYQIIVDKAKNAIDWSKHAGDHGFLNNQSSMFPIFIAHGPGIKKNFTTKKFYNVDIYPLMCLLLGVPEHANEGSLKNVIDMVVYNKIEIGGISYVYFLIFLVPIALMSTSCLFFCFCCGKKSAADSTHYSSINQNEFLLREQLNDMSEDEL